MVHGTCIQDVLNILNSSEIKKSLEEIALPGY